MLHQTAEDKIRESNIIKEFNDHMAYIDSDIWVKPVSLDHKDTLPYDALLMRGKEQIGIVGIKGRKDQYTWAYMNSRSKLNAISNNVGAFNYWQENKEELPHLLIINKFACGAVKIFCTTYAEHILNRHYRITKNGPSWRSLWRAFIREDEDDYYDTKWKWEFVSQTNGRNIDNKDVKGRDCVGIPVNYFRDLYKIKNDPLLPNQKIAKYADKGIVEEWYEEK